MPSIKTKTPILGGKYYHIFNRGSNRQNLFYSPKNYTYFLKLLGQYLTGYVDFLGYCLLPNHFHLVLRTYDELITENVFTKKELINAKNRQLVDLNLSNEDIVGRLVVRQFRRMFVSYSMAINKQENRLGNLFDPKYKRLEITNEDYLKYAIFYIHYNPEKHGLVEDFRNYQYSSFSSLLDEKETKLNRELAFEIFGGKDAFLNYHSVLHEEREAIILE